MISTLRLEIVEADESDIMTIIEIESHKENKDFLWVGTFEEHKAEIEDPDQFLWIFRLKDSKEVVGYALARINIKSEIFELRRIAIIDKGMGYGKESTKAMMKYAFNDLKVNRFWLDVYPDNLVGIKLYEGLGMKREGVLRQNYKSERGYLDQIIYSMLKSEYLQVANKFQFIKNDK